MNCFNESEQAYRRARQALWSRRYRERNKEKWRSYATIKMREHRAKKKLNGTVSEVSESV